MSRPMIRFVKETGCPSVSKVNNTEKSRKPTVKYAEMYRWMLKHLEEMSIDASKQGGMMDQGEDFGIERDSNKSTDKGSESTGEMANVFTTASPPVPPVSLFVPTVAATASEKDSTAAVITTTTAVTPYTRRTRASRGVQEQMSEHLAREPEEEFAQENQRLREQAARDGKIARLHTEGELKMMIDELDRSNEVIAIHLKEYAQAKMFCLWEG
ncbi:hypothetical protein Tco_0295279 [Tanacetum coccineum]